MLAKEVVSKCVVRYYEAETDLVSRLVVCDSISEEEDACFFMEAERCRNRVGFSS